MKAFLKENSVLVAGLSLPLIVALLFIIFQMITTAFIADPKYSVLFTTGHYNYNNQYSFYVRDNKLFLDYRTKENNNNNHSLNKPRVFVFNPKTKERREIIPPIINDESKSVKLVVDDLKANKIITAIVSPDGYEFDRDRYRGGGIATEIVGGSRYRNSVSVKKGGRRIAINDNDRNYYIYNAEFLGWIPNE